MRVLERALRIATLFRARTFEITIGALDVDRIFFYVACLFHIKKIDFTKRTNEIDISLFYFFC